MSRRLAWGLIFGAMVAGYGTITVICVVGRAWISAGVWGGYTLILAAFFGAAVTE